MSPYSNEMGILVLLAQYGLNSRGNVQRLNGRTGVGWAGMNSSTDQHCDAETKSHISWHSECRD